MNTRHLTLARWMATFGNGATPEAFVGRHTASAPRGGALNVDPYALNLSQGSYAVNAHDYTRQLTPARWMAAFRSGSRIGEQADRAGVRIGLPSDANASADVYELVER